MTRLTEILRVYDGHNPMTGERAIIMVVRDLATKKTEELVLSCENAFNSKVRLSNVLGNWRPPGEDAPLQRFLPRHQ